MSIGKTYEYGFDKKESNEEMTPERLNMQFNIGNVLKMEVEVPMGTITDSVSRESDKRGNGGGENTKSNKR